MIKNIIFDLGGVVLNIDFQRSADAFKELGISNFDKLYSRAVQNSLFENLEMGLISADKFRNQIRLLSNLNLSDQEIDDAWNAIILDFPEERLNLICQVSKIYSCYLLSNTNKIHYDIYQADLINHHNINGLESMFVKTWFSHDLKMRKPNKNIFEYALADGDLKPEETIFIDDSIQNIKVAEKLGIKTIFLDVENGDDISNYFSEGKLIMK